MTTGADIAKRLNRSENKDFGVLEFQQDYRFQNPVVPYSNPRDFIAFAKTCPFEERRGI